MLSIFRKKIAKRLPFSSGKSGLDASATSKLKSASGEEKEIFFSMLDSSELGLSSEQAEERQQQFGLNEVRGEKAPSWFVQLINAFLTPFNAVLIFIALISLM